MLPLRITASPSRTAAAPSSCATTISPTPVVVMKRPSAGAALHHLGVAGDDRARRPRAPWRPRWRRRSRRSASAKPSSMMKAAASASGRAAAVARSLTVPATDEAADVAAGKAQRLHHVAVGGEGDAAPRRQRRRVVEALEHRVGEGLHEDVLDQVAVQLAAAAVAEEDALAVSHRCPESDSAPRRRLRCSPCRRPPGPRGCSARRTARSRPGR